MPKLNQPEPQTPTDLNNIFQRVFAIFRTLFGSTVALIIAGAVILILLLILSIARGF